MAAGREMRAEIPMEITLGKDKTGMLPHLCQPMPPREMVTPKDDRKMREGVKKQSKRMTPWNRGYQRMDSKTI